MRYKKLLSSIISVTAVCAVLVSALSFSASAAEIDEEELISAPQAVLDSVSEGNTESSSLPSTYSSVDLGYVSSIKEQLYNDCWVYGALGTLESTLLKNDLYIGDMSVNHANIWGSTRSSGKGWVRRTGEAGRAKIMLGYLTSWQGAVLDSKLPGLELTDFTPDELPTGLADFGVTSIKYLYREDADSIKQAIMESGGISTYYSNSVNCFNYDTYSFYMSPDYADSYMGHAIEIVGWDDNYSRLNFKSGYNPPHNGAWLCKNSWGAESNSLNGYIWVSYDDPYLFGNVLSAPFAVKKVRKTDSNTKLYQVEEYGSTYDFNIFEIDENDNTTDVTNLTFINKFKFNEKYGKLESVVFETTSAGADYTVYLIPLESSGVPSSNESKWKKLASGTVEYSGYVSVDTSNYVLPYGSGAIGVKIDGTQNNIASKLGCDEWLTNSYGQLLFNPDVKKNTSYMKYGSTVYELSDFYSNYLGDDIGSNFVIKAVTTSDKGIKKYDVNNDGKISVADTVLIQRYLINSISFSRNQLFCADIDKNCEVTLSDAVAVQRKLLNL